MLKFSWSNFKIFEQEEIMVMRRISEVSTEASSTKWNMVAGKMYLDKNFAYVLYTLLPRRNRSIWILNGNNDTGKNVRSEKIEKNGIRKKETI